jgi:hypothetical protein
MRAYADALRHVMPRKFVCATLLRLCCSLLIDIATPGFRQPHFRFAAISPFSAGLMSQISRHFDYSH